MTSRDTHEMRLAHWPRLSTFPTTAGFCVAIIILDFLTFAAWTVFAAWLLYTTPPDGLEAAMKQATTMMPDGWLLFLTGLHAGGITQFGIKRKTWDPSKAPTQSNGGVEPPAPGV